VYAERVGCGTDLLQHCKVEEGHWMRGGDGQSRVVLRLGSMEVSQIREQRAIVCKKVCVGGGGGLFGSLIANSCVR
jgi:hypothetical protein